MLQHRISYLFLAGCLLLAACKGPVRSITFFAAGNCAECQAPIEAALQGQKGIHEVKWDFASSQLSVSYDPRRWDESTMQEKVSDAGFNTQFFDGDPTAKASLPACCQEMVERKLERANPHPIPQE